MSRGTETPPPPPVQTLQPPRATPAEAFIDSRLRQTRRQVKGVDLAAGLAALASGTLAYLLFAAVMDHWVVSGGLGFAGRLVFFMGLVAGAGWFLARCLLPPLVRPINPVFAAATIEQGRPALKNSLINLLLLRRNRRQLAPVIYHALEDRAAADLSRVPAELAVDRARAIRLGYLLVGTLAVFCLYLVFCPKDLLASAARIIWPWADRPAPTRVTIKDVEPGDTTDFYGEQVTVSAEVRGLRSGEPVFLYYTTADGQSVDQAVPMSLPEGYRHRCKLPPGQRGLQQDLRYYLKAGDSTTRHFNIDVQVAPAIVVDRLDYHYPDYTQLPDQTVEHQGDIRAIEGTRVTIRATANQPIRSASVDLGCDGRRELRMDAQGQEASAQLTLRLNEDDPALPEYDCYQLRFVDRSGRLGRRPIRHAIEVIRDLPPQIQLLHPQQEEVKVAEDGQVEIRVQAEDPDFALRRVALKAELAGRKLGIHPLLDELRQGPFQATYVFQPARLGLKAGDRVLYWAEAEDNKQPTAGRAETAQRWITIVRPESRQPDEQDRQPGRQGPRQGPQNNQTEPPPDTGQQPQPAEPQPDEPQPAQPGSQQPQQAPGQEKPTRDQASEEGTPPDQDTPTHAHASEGMPPDSQKQPAEEPRKPIDPNTQDGDAFEEILKQMQKDRQQQEQGDRQSTNQQTAQPQAQQQPSGQQPSGQQPGPQGDQQQPTGQQPGQQQGGGQQGDRQQPTAEQTSQHQGAQQQGTQQQGTEQQPGTQSGAEQPSGQQQGAQQQGSGQQPGTQGGAEQPSGQQQAEGQQSGGQQGSGQQATGQQATQQQATGQQAEGQQADQQQAGKQQGGGQQSGQQQASNEQGSGQQSGPQQGSGQQSGPQQGSGQQAGGQQGGQQQASREQGGRQQGAGQQGSEQEATRPEPAGPSSAAPGQPPGDQAASPSPQGANQPRHQEPGQSPRDRTGQEAQDSARSPSISDHQSDSQSDSRGDRSGGGRQGGGQQADQPGRGTPGSNTEAEQGGSPAAQQGNEQTGARGGNQVQTDQRTGQSATQEGGPRPDGRQQAGGTRPGSDDLRGSEHRQSDSSTPGTPQANPPDGGRPGERTSQGSSARGDGQPTGGGQPAQPPETLPPPEAREPGGDDPNLQYAQKATDLALEYLRNQARRTDSELLSRLGWTPQQAEQFLKKWQQLKRAAAQPGNSGEAARESLREALLSLGLRPRGTQLSRGTTRPDQIRDMRQAGELAAPDEWSEWLRAYTRGAASGQ